MGDERERGASDIQALATSMPPKKPSIRMRPVECAWRAAMLRSSPRQQRLRAPQAEFSLDALSQKPNQSSSSVPRAAQ